MYLLLHALCAALCILAVSKLYDIYPPMMWIKEKLYSQLPFFWLQKPLWACIYCMTSIYGTVYFVTFVDYGTDVLTIGKTLILFYLLTIGLLTQAR